MEARKRKNIISIINILLFSVILLVGIILIDTGDTIPGWVLLIISTMIILFSIASLMKRRKEN